MEKNNLDKQHIVSRSRPLLSLNKSELSLYELKVLDTYLSRINPHKPDERTVIFDKGSFEALFEYSELKLPELKAHLKNLQSLDVDIATSENEIDNIKLFSRAQARKDKYGLWEVILTCSPEAMTYFFNIESLGYLRYKLWNVLQLNSRYSYLLFLYLTDNRFRKEWTVSIDELKDILNCGQIESYQEFKNFRRSVLDRCKSEILQKTDIIFDYTTIKRGRYVSDIQFNITTWGELAEITAQVEQSQLEEKDDTALNDDISIMCSISDNTIDREDMQVIYDLILQLDIDKGSNGTGRIDYFKYILDRVKVAEKKKRISDKAAYIKTILLNELRKGDAE